MPMKANEIPSSWWFLYINKFQIHHKFLSTKFWHNEIARLSLACNIKYHIWTNRDGAVTERVDTHNDCIGFLDIVDRFADWSWGTCQKKHCIKLLPSTVEVTYEQCYGVKTSFNQSHWRLVLCDDTSHIQIIQILMFLKTTITMRMKTNFH